MYGHPGLDINEFLILASNLWRRDLKFCSKMYPLNPSKGFIEHNKKKCKPTISSCKDTMEDFHFH